MPKTIMYIKILSILFLIIINIFCVEVSNKFIFDYDIKDVRKNNGNYYCVADSIIAVIKVANNNYDIEKEIDIDSPIFDIEFCDSSDTLLFSISGDGILKYNVSTGFGINILSGKNITYFSEVSDTIFCLWRKNTNTELLKYNTLLDTYKILLGINNTSINYLFEVNSNIFIATDTQLLKVYPDTKSYQIQNIKNKYDNDDVTYIFSDKFIYKYDNQNNQFDKVISPVIPEGNYNSIVQDKNNYVWVSTDGVGIYYTNLANTRSGRVDIDTGLSSNKVRYLDKNDNSEDLLIITESGIDIIPITNIPREDYKVVLFPNPFPGDDLKSLKIGYYLTETTEDVSIEIYDLRGRLIKTILEPQEKLSGFHQENEWDGRDSSGQYVVPGIYFVKVVLNDNVTIKKCVFVGE